MSRELEALREDVKMLEEKEKESQVMLSSMNPREVAVGNSGRRYIVLKQLKEQTMILSVDLMAESQQFDSDSPNYAESDLKKRIESDILPAVEEDFGAENIIEHEVDLTTVDMQKDFGTCICKVRPVTFDEAREFNDLLVKEDLPDWYWTCTPWSTKERGWGSSLAVVSPSGIIYNFYCSFSSGVRPVLYLKSNIFVSKGE